MKFVLKVVFGFMFVCFGFLFFYFLFNNVLEVGFKYVEFVNMILK